MKKLILVLSIVPAIAWGAVTYTKNPDGTITKSEVLDASRNEAILGELSGKINQLNLQIAECQQKIIDLTILRDALVAELVSIEAAK